MPKKGGLAVTKRFPASAAVGLVHGVQDTALPAKSGTVDACSHTYHVPFNSRAHAVFQGAMSKPACIKYATCTRPSWNVGSQLLPGHTAQILD